MKNSKVKKCPFCQKENIESSQKCSCGYYFDKELYNKEHPNEKVSLDKEKPLHKVKEPIEKNDILDKTLPLDNNKTNPNDNLTINKKYKLGRIGRRSHFLTQLFLTLFQIIAFLLLFVLGDFRQEDNFLVSNEIFDNLLWGLVFIICGLSLILLAIISIRLYIKRLHDINLSGWNIFYFYIIPITVGILTGIILVINENLTEYLIAYKILRTIIFIVVGIFVIYVFVKPGTWGVNEFGIDPRTIKKKKTNN